MTRGSLSKKQLGKKGKEIEDKLIIRTRSLVFGLFVLKIKFCPGSNFG